MAVPFSITHLRVPRGLAAAMEGLVLEVLRDQPEDIPKYAAQHFGAVRKQREDSGMDPIEWAAKLEDSSTFKATVAVPEKEPATEVTISTEKSYEYQTEEDSSYSTETFNLSTTQPNVSGEVDLMTSTEEYKEKHDITEKHIILLEKEVSEEETVLMLPAVDVQPGDLSRADEAKDPTITTFDQVDMAANGKDSSSASGQDMSQSELEPTDLLSFRAIENVDVCAQELGPVEDEGGNQQESAAVDEKIAVSEGVKRKEEQVEVFPYSGLSDVDVCAAELGATEKTNEGATVEDVDDSLKPQPEETFVQSTLSQSENPGCNQDEAKDQVEKAKEAEATEAEASPGGINESSSDITGSLDSNAIPEKDSLVEISFEDVPEDQQIKVDENHSGEEGSVDVLQSKVLEMEEEKFEDVTVAATDQNVFSIQDQDELEMMGVKKAVHSEGGVMESQHEALHVMKEKVDTNDYNSNNSDDDDDDEKHKGVKTSSSHQPTTKADEENPEDEADRDECNEKMRDGTFHQKEHSEEEAKSNHPDYKEDETTDTVGGDKGDIHAEGHSEVEGHSSPVAWSNVSTTAAGRETLEESEQHLLEENDEGQRTPEECQPEDAELEKEVISKKRSSEAEDLGEEENIDSESIEKKSDEMLEEGSVIASESTERPAAGHRGEEKPLEKDSSEPEGKNADKDECSRPQEEEDIMDIPLDDPEANRAAAKIQAGFRGHMTRKKMKPEDKAEGEERQEDRGQ